MESNFLNDIDELIYKMGTDAQTLKTNLCLPKGLQTVNAGEDVEKRAPFSPFMEI